MLPLGGPKRTTSIALRAIFCLCIGSLIPSAFKYCMLLTASLQHKGITQYWERFYLTNGLGVIILRTSISEMVLWSTQQEIHRWKLSCVGMGVAKMFIDNRSILNRFLFSKKNNIFHLRNNSECLECLLNEMLATKY